MVNRQQALNGRTVYGGGTYAPTTGRVSAAGQQGYIARGVRQGGIRRVGGDGLSDTRSGLAAAALARRSNTSYFKPVGQPQASGLGGGGGSSTGRVLVNPAGVQAMAAMAPQAATAQAGGGPQGYAQSGPAAVNPQVEVLNNGRLELPYSPGWSKELLDMMDQYNLDLDETAQGQQTENANYESTKRQHEQNYTKQQLATLNANSGSGMAFSSAYGTQAASDAENYQNIINQLLSDHSAQQTAFDTHKNALIAGFRGRMQRDSEAYADELAANAGTYGFGQAENQTAPGQNASAYVPSAAQASATRYVPIASTLANVTKAPNKNNNNNNNKNNNNNNNYTAQAGGSNKDNKKGKK